MTTNPILISISGPVSFGGISFAFALLSLQDGGIADEPAGYVFQPLRKIPGAIKHQAKMMIQPALPVAPAFASLQPESEEPRYVLKPFFTASALSDFLASPSGQGWTDATETAPDTWETLHPGLFIADSDPKPENFEAACRAWTPPVVVAAPHRVLKDTIVLRIKEAGRLPQLRQLIQSLDADSRFEWDSASWFSSNNPLITQGIAALGLDAAVILAPDPLAP